jgi:hypothetical protein
MNQARPQMVINLDKPRPMTFDFNAMADFETVTGKNFLKINTNNLTATDFRAILWACMHTEDETLTIKEVGKLISRMSIIELSKKITEVVSIAVGQKEDTDPLASQPASGTG